MGLKRPFDFLKEKNKKLPKNFWSTYLFLLLAWLSYYFAEQFFLNIYQSSQSVGWPNFFLLPFFFVSLDAYISYLKFDKTVSKKRNKVQFLIFFLGHILWGLFIVSKSAPIINGHQATVLLFIGLLFLVGRVGFKGALLFSLIYLMLYSSFLYFLKLPIGVDDKIFFFFGLIFSFSFSSLGHFINKIIQKEKKSREILKSFNKELEKSVNEKTHELNSLNQSLIDMMGDVNEQKKSRERLLENLDEGFMVFNEKGIIQDGATQASEKHFGVKAEGKSISEILGLQGHAKENFLKWCDNVWKGTMTFRDLLPLAPKTFIGAGGKYIKLDFRPIFGGSGKKIEKVICIAADITNEKRLEEKANKEKLEVQMMLKILNKPVEFLNLVEDCQEIFVIHYKDEVIDVEFLFRIIHNLKANFSRFHALSLVDSFHLLEESLDHYREDTFFRKELPEELNLAMKKCEVDFNDFVSGHKELIEMTKREAQTKESEGTIFIPTMINFIIKNFGDESDFYQKFKASFLLGDLSEKFEKYKYLIVELSNSQGKMIHLEIEKMDFQVNMIQYRGVLSSCLHLLRNSVDHGIESPEEREKLGKSKKGKIKVSFKETAADLFQIIIEDDGKGVDPAIIRELALKKGLLKKEEIKKLTDKEIIQIIFKPGFSSKDEVTSLSGRGVGTDVVKFEVEKIGGEVRVISKKGKGTVFVLTLPIFR